MAQLALKSFCNIECLPTFPFADFGHGDPPFLLLRLGAEKIRLLSTALRSALPLPLLKLPRLSFRPLRFLSSNLSIGENLRCCTVTWDDARVT